MLLLQLLFTGGQESMLADKDIITADVVSAPSNDAGSVPVGDASPSRAKNLKQPKLCNTHYGKKECNFKPHASPKSEPKSYDRGTEEGDAMYDVINLSAAFCSAVVFLPTFYILFVSMRH